VGKSWGPAAGEGEECGIAAWHAAAGGDIVRICDVLARTRTRLASARRATSNGCWAAPSHRSEGSRGHGARIRRPRSTSSLRRRSLAARARLGRRAGESQMTLRRMEPPFVEVESGATTWSSASATKSSWACPGNDHSRQAQCAQASRPQAEADEWLMSRWPKWANWTPGASATLGVARRLERCPATCTACSKKLVGRIENTRTSTVECKTGKSAEMV